MKINTPLLIIQNAFIVKKLHTYNYSEEINNSDVIKLYVNGELQLLLPGAIANTPIGYATSLFLGRRNVDGDEDVIEGLSEDLEEDVMAGVV